MLKISNQTIVFQPRQKSKNLILTNELNQPIIYKIKTNNIDAIDAKPNCGLIQSNTSLALLIRAIKNSNFHAKLQVIYAITDKEGNADNFTQKWGKLQKSQLNYALVDIRRVDEINKNSQQVNPQEGNSNTLMRSLKSNNDNAQQSTIDERCKQFQKNLQIQINKNSKLKQQLQIAQNKVKMLNESNTQAKINRSMGHSYQQNNHNFTTLVLVLLSGIIIGFILRGIQ